MFCVVAALAGCAGHRGSGGGESAVSYGAAVSVRPGPSAIVNKDTEMIPSSPTQFPTGDSEQMGPRAEIEGTRNWGRDVLPIRPGLNRDENAAIRL